MIISIYIIQGLCDQTEAQTHFLVWFVEDFMLYVPHYISLKINI